MNSPKKPNDDAAPEVEKTAIETGSQPLQQEQQQQDTEIEVPSDVTPDDSLCRTPPSEQQDEVVPQEATPPPAPPPPQSRMEQLLEQFLAYESSLSMPDYIKRFYQIRLEQEALRCDPEFSVKCASEGMHVMRNRYRDILPYDRNRVTLSESEENPNGYINASFISLPKGRTRFIAAQAPLPTTLEEWWKMVDEQKVLLIVMLCKLVEMNKVKCERYWPVEIGQSLLFGHYEISLDGVDTFADDEYLLRRLRMTNQKTGESRVIHQLHYKEWPDHGCPSGESQLINMIEKMAELHESSDSPVLVHCSAGVGRTGTIISVNYIRELIESAELESLDLFELVMSLRKQRASMVQTQDQYQFVHKCVAFYCRRHLGLPQPPTPPKEDLMTNSKALTLIHGVHGERLLTSKKISPASMLHSSSTLSLSSQAESIKDDSFSLPTPIAPSFHNALPVNGDQLIQIDDDSDDESDGNSVPDFPHEPPAPRGPEELGSAAS